MTIMMESQDTALKEVVIIGYGSRKKVDNTTVSLKAEEISRTKVLNASQAIQGKSVSGIIRFTRSTPSVIIRGLGTALGGRTRYI
jgi:hypothetical protein